VPVPKPLRWILSTSAAILAGYVSWLLLTLATQAALRVFGQATDGGFARAVVEVVPHAAAGAAFVIVGSRLAPAPQPAPTLHLLLLLAILAGLVLAGVLAWPVGWQLVGAGAVIAGALLAVALLHPRRGT